MGISIFDMSNYTPGGVMNSRLLARGMLLLLLCGMLMGFQKRNGKMGETEGPEFSYITSEQGLDSDECNFVFEDSEGFVWIGTDGGLFRYDGYELLNFEHIVGSSDHKIGRNRYFGMTEGPDKVLWIASSQGVFSYCKKTASIALILKGEKIFNRTISGVRIIIACDTYGKIWMGGTKGVFVYDPEQKGFKHYNAVDGKWMHGIRDILVSASGEVWIATWGDGLFRYQRKADKFEALKIFTHGPLKRQHNTLSALYEDEEGYLWVGTWGDGLYKLDITNPECPEILNWYYIYGDRGESVLPSYIIYDISEDLLGRIWVGTPFGISILEKTLAGQDYAIKNYNYSEENKRLNNNEVKSITRSRSGLMWLATYGGGINKADLRKDRFPLYHIVTTDPFRKSQSVYAFTRDPGDRLLLGIYSLGFGVYDMDTHVFTPYTEIPEYRSLTDLEINTVKNFTWDKNGYLWLGTRYKGLIRYDPDQQDYLAVNRDKDGKTLFKEVFQVRTDLKNNLWSLTNKGLFHIVQEDDAEDCRALSFAPLQADSLKPITSDFSDFVIDRGGYFYLATVDGDLWKSTASIYEPAEELCFEKVSRPVEKNKSINALFVDSRQQLWVGTNNGLEIYDKNAQSYNTHLLSGINNLSVHSMEEDDRGNLLVTSNKGVIYMNVTSDELDHKMFTTRNGLQANFFIKDAIYKDPEGGMYIGGHRGFNYIQPLEIKEEFNPPALTFTRLQNSGRTYFSAERFSKDEPFSIPYDDNIISISFTSLDLRAPENLYYAYRLKGLEEDWKYVSFNNRTATYINLPPGNYTFEVKGTNGSGQWSRNAITLPVYVETAPYLTWWAYVLYILVFLSVMTLIFILYLRKTKAKEALKIENIERVKSERLTQFKLQFFTNLSHELLTPLSILMILSDRDDKEGKKDSEDKKILKRNVQKLNSHIKQMLHFRKAETGNMEIRVQRCDISRLMADIGENYKLLARERDLTFNMNVEEDITAYADADKLEICVNNLLSNAFKYTASPGTVTLRVGTAGYNGNRNLVVEVSDTGKGIPEKELKQIFDRYYRLPSFEKGKEGLGIGLSLVRHMVHIQQGRIEVESEVDKGTCFKMELPIGKERTVFSASREGENLLADAAIGIPEEEKLKDIVEEVEYSGKRILLVEDNEDYLKLVENHLGGFYQVISCTDGKKALDIAHREDIDLIVSDLRIPGMNGADFCKAVKSHVNTSHIPFIIITANTKDQARIQGYGAGADSYFIKPLSLNVLIYRIESLLEKKEKAYQKFNRGQYLEPENIVSTKIDEDFLDKARQVVEDHMSEVDFSVKKFCEEMGMSNSMFYRKIKGILNLTPNEFIKNVRLRRAAQLLADESIHISEVAYMTGFNDLSYFGVCFKKQYGVSPSSYQKSKHHNHPE
ncbi:hybrid sensor histidine kinase/response regulator transcription factor [Sinomicrobium soli]|uniref:hybrid sensor histidine kinase/response regulator transcription factor n=1 Tax=Sinomicrobium sp. N-1-3-6 TaxID=2219864 RepID=UPI000DCD3E69|nr:hybrid sensor histidine kinase/response regulator transcription factor [Sinomicrobium sp. N-1-3-6]RAV29582.1 hypothetical protein DN748_08835 [Sinomicrobium sp. N-1-3-6]